MKFVIMLFIGLVSADWKTTHTAKQIEKCDKDKDGSLTLDELKECTPGFNSKGAHIEKRI